MMLGILTLFLLFIIPELSIQDNVEKNRWVINAAVVEYYGTTDLVNSTNFDIVMKNADNYEKIIELAKQDKLDIVVFPEYGLTGFPYIDSENATTRAAEYRKQFHSVATYIPDPKMKLPLCDPHLTSYSKVLHKISCAAKNHETYVVINLIEKVDCNFHGCPNDQYLLFDSNVVFDRQGKLIARYRKCNLLNDPGIDRPLHYEPSNFKTDFGITFGQMIGSDILMNETRVHFWENPEIMNIVMPSRYLEQLPLVSFMQYQTAWAHSLEVNLLVSSHSEISGTSGSGVYKGVEGPVLVSRPKKPSNELLSVSIPAILDIRGKGFNILQSMDDILKPPHDSFVEVNSNDNSFSNVEYINSEVVNFDVPLVKKKICVKDFCCLFSIEFENVKMFEINDHKYRALVYSGPHNFSDYSTAQLNICAYAFCEGDGFDKCKSDQIEGHDLQPPLIKNSEITTFREGNQTFCNPISEFFLSQQKHVNEILRNSENGINFAETNENQNQLTIALKPGFNSYYLGIFCQNFEEDNLINESHKEKQIQVEMDILSQRNLMLLSIVTVMMIVMFCCACVFFHYFIKFLIRDMTLHPRMYQ